MEKQKIIMCHIAILLIVTNKYLLLDHVVKYLKVTDEQKFYVKSKIIVISIYNQNFLINLLIDYYIFLIYENSVLYNASNYLKSRSNIKQI